MENAITALVTALTSAINMDTLLGGLTAFIPWVGGIVLFAFIYRVLRRSVSGASKGKAKI